ncbi:threonine ammonia-lyase [Sedimentitalea sp. CY04]|uniref:Threonine ammonia-lyase n=1 Tax=Parasedimentitalea denitrificans TaxID=2211118 RepID=A0ABX0W8R3_9RHOB|nr:threonine/serine dehydratase [Sedimentitalea sp. CY04]NIZ62002.1 threonine ammonia-lyase [Sedimentitalea sp. CY04]
MTSLSMINAAAKRLDGHARVTPLLSSPFLDDLAQRRILVKPECLQHTGSFKFRGGWSALSALDKATRGKGVIAYSSGNHAQGIAHAATLHGVPSVIVMPADAPQLKIENTRALGAEVILYDRASEDRDAIGLAIAEERDLTLIKPFDEPQVIAGQGTVGLEIAQQSKELGITTGEVLVNCGGGGLTSGIALALETEAPEMQVRPCEPTGFDDVTRSLASGDIECNSQTSGSICDAILTPSPGQITFPIMKRLCGSGIVVSEDEALHAMALAYSRLKIVLEPGGAISLAAALFHGKDLSSDTAIVVATGGNVDPSIFAQALQRFT